MMGTKERAFALLHAVTLDDLVPADHFYRQLEAQLDLAFVRDLVRDCYAARGRPSVDPVVFFKLQLILFFEGLRSERQLLAVVADRLSLRWYLGYDLGERLPDHSSLTKIRERYGLAIFRRFFEYVVELCQQAGLVWGQELLADATKVRANASLDSFVPRLKEVVDEHLVDLFGAPGAAADGPDPVPEDPAAPPLLHAVPAQAEDAPATATSAKRWELLEECRLDPSAPRPGATSASPRARSAAPTQTPPPWSWPTSAPPWAIRTTTSSMAARRASSSTPSSPPPT